MRVALRYLAQRASGLHPERVPPHTKKRKLGEARCCEARRNHLVVVPLQAWRLAEGRRVRIGPHSIPHKLVRLRWPLRQPCFLASYVTSCSSLSVLLLSVLLLFLPLLFFMTIIAEDSNVVCCFYSPWYTYNPCCCFSRS